MKYPEQNLLVKYSGGGNVSKQVIVTAKDGKEYKCIFDFDNEEWETEDAEYFAKDEIVSWEKINSQKDL